MCQTTGAFCMLKVCHIHEHQFHITQLFTYNLLFPAASCSTAVLHGGVPPPPVHETSHVLKWVLSLNMTLKWVLIGSLWNVLVLWFVCSLLGHTTASGISEVKSWSLRTVAIANCRVEERLQEHMGAVLSSAHQSCHVNSLSWRYAKGYLQHVRCWLLAAFPLGRGKRGCNWPAVTHEHLSIMKWV